MRHIPMIALAAASGVALVASFAPFSIWPLAWLALVPMFVIYQRTSFKVSIMATLLMGLVFFGGLMYWIGIFGRLPWFLLALYQSIYLLGFCVIAYRSINARSRWMKLVAVPAAWAAFEWLRSLGAFGFTWGDLAQSQVTVLPAIQITSLTGPWGLAFAIVAVNVAVAEIALTRKTSIARLTVPAMIVLGIFAYGWTTLRDTMPAGNRLRLAIIQGNVDQDVRPPETWDEHRIRTMAEYLSLTADALKHKPDLVIWPETAIPDYMSRVSGPKWQLEELARASSTCLLVGASDVAPTVDEQPREYNGAFLFSPDGRLSGTYYKTHLVPFGEVVFGRKWLPFLERYKVRDIDYSPGPGYRPIRAGLANLGVMICFESIFPQIARKLTSRGADVLVVMTNDAWFERTAAAEQHHAMSILRAVENRRFVARDAATGISSVIDPWGRVLDSAAIFTRKTIYREVIPIHVQTFYTRFGDWFAYLSVMISVMTRLGYHRNRKSTDGQKGDG